jgi:ferredoxin
MCRDLSRPNEAPQLKDQTIMLTIDGRKLRAPAGGTLLAVARDAGIEIPTLCDHPVVEPVGACRLCMVEVTHPDWAGWTGLVAACLYPATNGLVVQTASESVRAARREVLSVLAARCPTAPTIRALAARHGAVSPAEIRADSCIMCGLCLRVCEAWATSPITTHADGSLGTAVGPFVEPAGCVGCGACASVCPTAHIAARRTDDHYEIWGHRFETPICVVDESRCVGCGACEEACPFSVARVALAVGGGRIARIPAASCRGCGACLGACPGGAITQPAGEQSARLAPNARLAVFACGRAALARESHEGIDAHELFCAGRVSVPLLLAELAAGRDGVLVLGRHEESCRLRGAEDPARERVARAAELAQLCGLGEERVRFAEPEPGLAGPPRAAAALAAELGARPLAPPRAGVPRPVREDLDELLAFLPALALRGSGSDGRAYLARRGLPPALPGAPALCAGRLPYLELAAGSMLSPLDVSATLRSALAVLSRLGVAGAGIAVAGPTPLATAALREASAVYVLDPDEVAPLRAQGLEAQLLAELVRARGPGGALQLAVACGAAEQALLSALGLRAIDVGPDPLADRSGFALGPDDRRRAEAHLARAEGAGAAALLVSSPAALVRWALVTRHGTWRSSRIAALLPHELAHRLWFDLPLAQPAAFRPAARSLEVRP